MALRSLADCVAVHRAWERREGPHSPFDWCVGFLDRALGPACPGHLYVIGASTNVGKSMFSLMLIASGSEPRVMISLEDGPAEVGRRVLELPDEALARGQVAFPTGSLTSVIDVMRKAALGGARMVIVDYLQLVAYNGPNPVWARNDEVRETIKELKAVGRELGIVPVVTSQVKRLADHTKAPTIFDLAESAAIERSAEAVIMLYSPDRGKHVKATIAKSKSTPVGDEALYERGRGGWLREITESETLF